MSANKIPTVPELNLEDQNIKTFKGVIVNAAFGVNIANASAGFTPITFNNVLATDGNYNTTTGVYTVPEDGIYDIKSFWSADFSAASAYTLEIAVQVNGSLTNTGYLAKGFNSHALFGRTMSISTTLPLNAGDEVRIVGRQNLVTSLALAGSNNRHLFSIYKAFDLP